MTALRELLVGYCDPKQLAISERPVGENGLTRRLAEISCLWEISTALRRKQCWRFGQTHFPDVFGAFVGTMDITWLTEVLRIMDRPRTKRGKTDVENLTVGLCHERFQADSTITSDQKVEEHRRYNALSTAYDAAGLRDFRNQQMFHLDLSRLLASTGQTGNVLEITALLVDWFAHVGRVCFGQDPVFVTRAHVKGKRIAKEFRRMLMARLRELVGVPRTRTRFKSAAWNALHAAIATFPEQDIG